MLGGDWGGPTEMLGEQGEQAGDTRGDFLSGLMDLRRNTINTLTGTGCALTYPFLSSSFLISEVMSKPRKGFWSGSLVGEENLLSLSTSCWLPRRSPGLRSGLTGGLTEPPLLMASSDNKIQHQTRPDLPPSSGDNSKIRTAQLGSAKLLGVEHSHYGELKI